MIADAIYHNNAPPTLYLRHRDDKGNLIVNKVDDYRPHLYVTAGQPNMTWRELKKKLS